jgi:hypothetical protein
VCAWLVSLFILPIPVLQPVVSPPCVDLSHDFPLVDLPLADLLPVENGGRADCLFPHRGEDARHAQPGSRDYPAREPWVWHPVPRWECSAGKTRRTGSPPLFRSAISACSQYVSRGLHLSLHIWHKSLPSYRNPRIPF